MSLPSFKQTLSLIVTTFAGAAEGYVVSHLGAGLPDTKTQWEMMGAGAALAGLAAVIHLYQPAPSSSSSSS